MLIRSKLNICSLDRAPSHSAMTHVGKRVLLHADRVIKLIAIGLTYPQAVRVSDADAKLLIEAAEIMNAGCVDGDADEGSVIVITVGPDE